VVFGLIEKGYRKYRRKFMNREEIFRDIYRINEWGGKGTRSGKGSEIGSTINIRKELPILLKELQIKSMLDIPCGDFNWIKEVDLDFLSYTGADIVPEIIDVNNKKYSSKFRKFIKLDIITQNLPQTDLILCRDLFIHLSFKDIFKAIENIKRSGTTYLLTNSYHNVTENKDISTGKHHRVNLLISPFLFPKPMKTLDDQIGESSTPKVIKKLCLWNISNL